MKNLKKVSVIGMGLLGSSVALSVKRELSGTFVIGYSHRSTTRDKARQFEHADKIVDTLAEAVEDVDIVILATPIQTFQDYFKEMIPHLKPGCIVTDVGSTKTLSHKWAKKLPKTVHYVGSHPIAGSEKRGLEYARDDLLDGAYCILTRVRGTHQPSVELLDKFWTKLGCQVEMMTPAGHDRLFGMVSHLPHITATALVNANSQADIRFAGRGFIDTTRVSSGPANVWGDILMTNPKTCIKGIDKLIAQLQKIQDAIEAGDQKKVEKLLSQAADKRSKMIEYKIQQKELF
ncbi:MAG: prephenate dehydrogenase [Planctomycetota bacterium]|jgi:prephenate dehydrogenase